MAQAEEKEQKTTAQPEADTAAQTSEPDASQGHVYDFRRPQHLSAEHIRAVHRLHACAVEAIQNRLARCLGAPLTARLKGVEQLNYSLMAESLPDQAYVSVLSLSPLQEKGLLLLDGGLCLGFVDRILGGQSKETQALRPFTDVDQVALERPIGVILECLRGGWQDFCPIELAVASQRADLRQTRVFGAGEVVLSVTMEISGEFAQGPMKLCLPMAPLKSALDGVAQRVGAQRASPERIVSLRKFLQVALGRVSLPITASVGSTELTVRHLLNLGTGDVVRLDQAADSPVLLQVSDRPVFACKMGLRGRKKAVQVVERIDTSMEE